MEVGRKNTYIMFETSRLSRKPNSTHQFIYILGINNASNRMIRGIDVDNMIISAWNSWRNV